MSKLAARLMGVSLVLGMGIGAAPAFAQDSGIANTAEDFPSAEAGEGFGGTNVDIWDIMHRARSGGGVDDGFRRSQSRRLGRESESFLERQRAAIEQREAENTAAPAESAIDVEISE